MKKNYYTILILIVSLFSCNNKYSTKNVDSKTIQTEKNIVKNKKKKDSTNEKYADLFNIELVGLTKDSQNNKKYHIDFSSACMCNSPSILLKDKKAYLFGYCKDKLPPLSKYPFYTYNIIETNEITNGLSVLLENENNKTLELNFYKSENEFIYKLKFIGEFPNDYIGNRVNDYFTSKPDNFKVEDCGDFDG